MSDPKTDTANWVRRRLENLNGGGPLSISDYTVMEAFGYTLFEYLDALQKRLADLESEQ